MKPEQLTAWALNELPAEERARLEAALREDPDCETAARETRHFCDFLLHELRDESLALTPEQRARLQTSTPAAETPAAPVAAVKTVRWTFVTRFGPLAAAAACAVMSVLIMIQVFKSEFRPVASTQASDDAEYRVNYEISRIGTGGALDGGIPRLPLKGGSASEDGDAAVATVTAALPFPSSPGVLPSKPLGDALSPVSSIASGGIVPVPQTPEDAGKALAEVMRVETKPLPTHAPALAYTENAPMLLPSRSLSAGRGGGFGTGEAPVLAQTETRAFEPQLDAPAATFRDQATPSSESYARLVENTLTDVRREPLSTFSIDVDTASYANVRRFLNQNSVPPRDAVRIEELINYFPTNEEGPKAEAKEPFAVQVELASCPWHSLHQLARVSVKGRAVEKGTKPSNLVFLVDVSGSMGEPQKLPLVQQILRMLAQQLGENDRVSMVTYASGTQVVLPPTSGQNRGVITAAVDQLRANGSTNGSGGLQLAYEQAVAGFIKEGVNRVILCTDGDFNVGISDPEQLQQFIAEKARGGVFLSVLGFGSGNLKDRTMETLADKGNGNYAYIDSLSEARKVLVDQMSGTLVTIAKDVKIQVEFNPALVGSYRLIGYENRMLAKEDFNDDTKDAGEIGAGHSVVALYELVPSNVPPGEEPNRIVDTLKYQTLTSPADKELKEKKTPATNTAPEALSNEVMTVKLRYKQPEGEVSEKIELPVLNTVRDIQKAGAEMKFSAAVAGFGLLLRDSSYKGELTWERVRQLALAGKGADKLGYRGEFLQLIDKAAGLKAAQRR